MMPGCQILLGTMMGLQGRGWGCRRCCAGWGSHSIHRAGGDVKHRTQSKRCRGNRQEPNSQGLLCSGITRQIWRVLLFKYNV